MAPHPIKKGITFPSPQFNTQFSCPPDAGTTNQENSPIFALPGSAELAAGLRGGGKGWGWKTKHSNCLGKIKDIQEGGDSDFSFPVSIKFD
jgi:hypothetical protein